MNAVTLAAPPALGPLLLRGALWAPFKRPAPGAAYPHTRLLLPGVRIDLARLAAYERVCGYPTGAAGLPVTYPHVLGFPLAMRLMSRRDFPLPLPGLVHTSIGIRRMAALPADAEYEVSVWTEGLSAHRRGTEATVVTALCSGGRPVWSSRSTYLARHGTARPDDGPHGTPAAAGRTGAARVAGGALPVVAEWRLAGDVGRRYAAVSGDRNPIHVHPLTARPFGFRRAIAHGMWTVARCLAAHGSPDAAEVRARFRAPVPLPGTVVYGADGGGRFELRDGRGRVHLDGEVRDGR
ncbi:MaoC family dehydratase [Streptomyces sp. NPDC017248]|uniref:MaoC family dehydratase n=1 Tax=unclassified Streptomyces TaxID=2593676 RepID=UPI0037BD9822